MTPDRVSFEREHQILTEARAHLAKGWVKGRLFGDRKRYGDGPVCAHGAILRVATDQEIPYFTRSGNYWYDTLWDLFVRLNIISESMFGLHLVTVNDDLGQEAALKVFDARIKEVEDQIANKLIESANQAQLEPVLATKL